MGAVIVPEVLLREPRLLVNGRQPSGRCVIDWNNPISHQLTFAYSPIQGLGVELVSGIVPVVVGTGTITQTTMGRGFSSTYGSSYGLSFTGTRLKSVISSGNTNYTIFSYGAPTPYTLRGALFSNGNDATTPWPQQSLLANAGNALSSQGKIELNEWDNVEAMIGYSASNTVVDGLLHTFTAIRKTTAVSLYRDGYPLSVSYRNPTSNAANIASGETYVCGTYGSSRAVAGPIILTMVWDRALTPLEVSTISKDPFNLFIPA